MFTVFELTLGICAFKSGRHEASVISVSSTRFQRLVTFHSPTQFLGVAEGILDLQSCSVVDQTHAFDDVELIAARDAVVDPMMIVHEAHGIHHQRVAFPMAIDSPLKLGMMTSGSVCLRPSR